MCVVHDCILVVPRGKARVIGALGLCVDCGDAVMLVEDNPRECWATVGIDALSKLPMTAEERAGLEEARFLRDAAEATLAKLDRGEL